MDKIISTRALFEENEVMATEAASDGNTVESQRDPAPPEMNFNKAESQQENSFVSVLKDFLRSTFSDQYPTEVRDVRSCLSLGPKYTTSLSRQRFPCLQQTYCCGGDELLAVAPTAHCCKDTMYARIASDQLVSTEPKQMQPSCTRNLKLQQSLSHGSETHPQKVLPVPTQRKKALAVATACRYAEDMDGRPIVIVPGTRKTPIDLTSYTAYSKSRQQFRQQRERSENGTSLVPKERASDSSFSERESLPETQARGHAATQGMVALTTS